MSAIEQTFGLRPLQPGDAPDIARLIGVWDVLRWLAAPPSPYAVAEAEAFIAANATSQASGDGRTHAVIVDGAFAGVVGLDRRSRGMNLGYWLGQPYWGRGIMGRAAAWVTADFFATSDEKVLNSGYFSGNEASAAIQRKLGFVVTDDGLLFNRPVGRRLPHVHTLLTRQRFTDVMARSRAN